MPKEINEIPPILYKFLPHDRLHVLRDCRVRFTQRSVFKDDHELQPDYASFGTHSDIWRFILSQGLRLPPGIPTNVLVQLIADSSKYQQQAVDAAVRNIRSLNEVGLFCLAEVCDSDEMWVQYSGGVVIAFDTTSDSFNALRVPGLFGKVSYSDAAIESFLGMMRTDPFAPLFRKRTKYSFEREWRSIRLLKQLERRANEVFVAPFGPACVRELVIRGDCALRDDLRQIVEDDARWSGVQIRELA